jgi:flagellar biosynthesis regulator FlbT
MINQAKRRTSVLTSIGLTDKVVNTANVFQATYRERSEKESEDKVVNTANISQATYRERSEQESERQRASLVLTSMIGQTGHGCDQ